VIDSFAPSVRACACAGELVARWPEGGRRRGAGRAYLRGLLKEADRQAGRVGVQALGVGQTVSRLFVLMHAASTEPVAARWADELDELEHGSWEHRGMNMGHGGTGWC
jgi:hypothetical protein